MNFTRIEIPKMNYTVTPKDIFNYGRVVVPLREAAESWYEDESVDRPS